MTRAYKLQEAILPLLVLMSVVALLRAMKRPLPQQLSEEDVENRIRYAVSNEYVAKTDKPLLLYMYIFLCCTKGIVWPL